MSLKKVALAVSSLLISVAAHAAPVTINFDDIATGVSVGSAYSGLGVTFSNAETTGNGGLPGATAPNTIASISSGYQPQPNTPIFATFASAMSSVSLTGIDVGVNGFILTAYDALIGGSIIDTHQVFGGDFGVGSFYTLSVAGSGIRRVEFSQVNNAAGDGIVFDNLVFEASDVPEPASIALLGLGLLGLAAARRKA